MTTRSPSAILACALILTACSDSPGPKPTERYTVAVRFFGAPVSSAQRALFDTAAARIGAMIVGPLPAVAVNGAQVSQQCTPITPTPVNETTTGLIIYASIDEIDGRGQVLAEAGPCFIRQANGVDDYRTVVGIMKFDSADVASLAGSGNLQELITHEMLHVVGFGAFWGADEKNLLVNEGTATAAYSGAGGIAGCRSIGGTATCSSSVPVENCVGRPNCGAGTLESHWRESTFGSELMTGFLNAGANPLSVMTIRSLEDLGYQVNLGVADMYAIFLGSLRAADDVGAVSMLASEWERPLRIKPKSLPTVLDE